MSLILIQPGIQPIGQFDLSVSDTIVGGEIGVFESIGMFNGLQSVIVRKATIADSGPFFLLDDGSNSYGTLINNVVFKTDTGFINGQSSNVTFGIASYLGSNKVTLWDKPGIYGITLDALADNEASLKTALPGTILTFDAFGRLKIGNLSDIIIAYVIRFTFDESLVTTNGNVLLNKKLIIYFNPIVVKNTIQEYPYNIIDIISDTTVDIGNHYRVNTIGGDITITLPTPSLINKGRDLTIKKISGANNMIIYSSAAVDGVFSESFSSINTALIIRSTGTTWDII